LDGWGFLQNTDRLPACLLAYLLASLMVSWLAGGLAGWPVGWLTSLHQSGALTTELLGKWSLSNANDYSVGSLTNTKKKGPLSQQRNNVVSGLYELYKLARHELWYCPLTV